MRNIFATATATAALTGLILASNNLTAQAGSAEMEEYWAATDVTYRDREESTAIKKALSYPAGLFQLPDTTKYVIWVELVSGRLNVLERKSTKNYSVVKSIPISIGKKGYGKEVEGDKRTPVGVYRVNSYIPDEDLDSFYGLGAYPVNYPNAWDKLNKRTGHGIWLHGLPKGVDQRPLLDSDGCVVVDNPSLTYLDDHIFPGDTMIVLAEEMNWVNEDTASDESVNLLSAIKSWEESWESGNADAYLKNYHPEFSNFNLDFAGWSEYKTRINKRKTFIEVGISDMSVLAYPGEEELVSVRFFQDYKSSNYTWAGWKELLWKKDDQGNWKILFEGNG